MLFLSSLYFMDLDLLTPSHKLGNYSNILILDVPLSYLLSLCYFCRPFLKHPNIFIVAPMENKRDASSAGLTWPMATTREISSLPTTNTSPGVLTSTLLSTPSSAPVAPMISPSGTASVEPLETYTALSSPAAPFPPADRPHHGVYRHSRYYERVVHQIHFKIFTHANNERHLYIEEIPATGISKSRDPEHFFYGLSGNWDWSCQTADYWRHFFELPLVHGSNPFRSVAIDNMQPPEPTPSQSTLATLACQLSDSLTAARASGELSEVLQNLGNMSFGNAIQTLQALQGGSTSSS